MFQSSSLGIEPAGSWRLDPAKCLLLVVDVQERLFAAMHEKEFLQKKVEQITAGCAALGIPIVYSEQYPKGLGPTLPALKTLAPGRWTKEKLRFSAAELLQDDTETNVLVCGMEAHICVRQTVYDLRVAQKNPVLLVDATASRTPLSKEIALHEMRRDGVVLSTVESILFELLGGSDHPKFKEISKIIK